MDTRSAASGEAKVKAKPGATNIELSLIGMTQPSTLGAEFLTYVLWVVTPDGRSENTGEIIIDKNGESQLKATTPAQTFSLIVTAEPYFAVRYPSENVILARLSGIILAQPGLALAFEGHTDSVGGDEANQKLSEQRADTVRSYLIG